MAEMERLYGDAESEAGEPDLTGLDDAEHIREMARTVGAGDLQQHDIDRKLAAGDQTGHIGNVGRDHIVGAATP